MFSPEGQAIKVISDYCKQNLKIGYDMKMFTMLKIISYYIFAIGNWYEHTDMVEFAKCLFNNI